MGHTVLFSCYDNGDGTAVCEGGFSDGSDAAGVEIRVEADNGQVLIKGKMDEISEFTFKIPPQSYHVVFDAGKGHAVVVEDDDILE